MVQLDGLLSFGGECLILMNEQDPSLMTFVFSLRLPTPGYLPAVGFFFFSVVSTSSVFSVVLFTGSLSLHRGGCVIARGASCPEKE